MKKVELPDFDDLTELAKKIGNEKTKIMLVESELESLQAEIVQDTTLNEKYWIGGKPPSNAYIKDTYYVLGRDELEKMQIATLKNNLATLNGELKTDENLFRVYMSMIEVWRTQSANERGAYLE